MHNTTQLEYGYISHGGEADNPHEIAEEIIKEYEKKIETGLNREDFESCKRQFYAWSIMVFDNTSSIANEIINSLFLGFDYLDLPEVIASITFEDVENRLKKIFKRENFVLSIVSPID